LEEIKSEREEQIRSLKRFISWAPPEDKGDVRKQKNMREYIDYILEYQPPDGWHCPDVGNYSQQSGRYWEMDQYARTESPETMARQMVNMIRLVERYDREMNLYSFRQAKEIPKEKIIIPIQHQKITERLPKIKVIS
jgi:hypothetical protein